MSQPREALKVANVHYHAQAALRSRIMWATDRNGGCLRAAAFLDNPTEPEAGIRAVRLIEAIPRVGPARAALIIQAGGVSREVRVRELTYGQRSALAGAVRMVGTWKAA